MRDRYLAKSCIFSLLVVGLLAAVTVDGAEDDASGYVNDPFTMPGKITPYTLPEAWPAVLPHRTG